MAIQKIKDSKIVRAVQKDGSLVYIPLLVVMAIIIASLICDLGDLSTKLQKCTEHSMGLDRPASKLTGKPFNNIPGQAK